MNETPKHPMCAAGEHDYIRAVEVDGVRCSRCGATPDERPFNDRSTTVNPMDFSGCAMSHEDMQAMADAGPLAGITLEREDSQPGGPQFRWKWPDGGSRPASLTEVLLYEILYHVSSIGIDDDT